MQLGTEEVAFLSTIRCRHFFASIAPSLLQAVSETPDPDLALVNLDNVTRSLGAKGVLWESLSQHPPLLRLFVQLCSWSQFLSEILITNPGMIDELLDTLVMNREPTRAELSDELALLMKGAEDIRPILHSFKSTTLLGIAIQDILGERTIHQTTQRLSDLAEVILSAMADHHFAELSRKLGLPRVGGPTGPVAAYALIGLGKFGGAELGYHGDIDLMLLYEDDGETVHSEDASRPGTTHFHFFSELLQRMVRTSTEATSGGKLYSLDLRLRPTGRSGSLVYPLFRFETYYQTEAALWERQALTRARVLRANKSFGRRASDAIRRAITARPWQEDDASAILQMRQRLEESRGPTSLKRGRGGQADIEFAVQLAQLRHASDQPTILESNVCKAIDLLQKTGIWNSKRAKLFKEAYTFLRTTEARLRIVYNVARDDLPTDPQELGKLAARCGYASGEKLRAKLEETMAATRSEFLRVVEEARTP
jgi:glutamate-ammonia-ligase adenylyltransferase